MTIWFVDGANLAVCRRVTGRFAGSLEYVAADSVEFLSRWTREGRGEIHLLYPDSVDHMPHAGHNTGSEEHSLREVQGALASLASPALVLIDDAEPAGRGDAAGRPEFIGKGARSVPFLLDHGFRIEHCEQRQVVLVAGA